MIVYVYIHIHIIYWVLSVVNLLKYCQALLEAIESEHAARQHEGGEGEKHKFGLGEKKEDDGTMGGERDRLYNATAVSAIYPNRSLTFWLAHIDRSQPRAVTRPKLTNQHFVDTLKGVDRTDSPSDSQVQIFCLCRQIQEPFEPFIL